jgi:hypothetical protein
VVIAAPEDGESEKEEQYLVNLACRLYACRAEVEEKAELRQRQRGKERKQSKKDNGTCTVQLVCPPPGLAALEIPPAAVAQALPRR